MDIIPTNHASRRIVVVIPDSLASELGLAHRIHRLAVEKDCPVLYITVARGRENMLTTSRCLTTLAAATAGNRVQVDWKLTTRAELPDLLARLSQPGDLLYTQQSAPDGAVRLIPVASLSGIDLDLPADPSRPAWIRHILPAAVTLFGFLAIIAGFTWLEIVLDESLGGALQRVTLIAAFCIEIGAIWIWNKLASW